MKRTPDLSVVLIVGNQRDRAALSLKCLLEQEAIERAEVLLIDVSVPGTHPLAGSNSPHVTQIRKDRVQAFGELRAEGARAATGRLVGYVEEHCFVQPGWITAALKHLGGPWAAVGGEMHTVNPGVGISDAVAMMNYTAWRPPAQSGESELLPGQNGLYRRDVLLSFGGSLGALLQNEAVLHWELAKRGYRLGIDPDLKFAHANETDLWGICRGYYLWHRCFGENRARFARMSIVERGFRALTTPALPVIRAIRIGRYLAARRPHELRSFVGSLPTVLISQSFAALGMLTGLILGSGGADVAFSIHDTDQARRLPHGFDGRAP